MYEVCMYSLTCLNIMYVWIYNMRANLFVSNNVYVYIAHHRCMRSIFFSFTCVCSCLQGNCIIKGIVFFYTHVSIDLFECSCLQGNCIIKGIVFFYTHVSIDLFECSCLQGNCIIKGIVFFYTHVSIDLFECVCVCEWV